MGDSDAGLPLSGTGRPAIPLAAPRGRHAPCRSRLCTIPEIASISGHSLAAVEQILQRYLVRTANLAEAAFRKRLAAETFSVLR